MLILRRSLLALFAVVSLGGSVACTIITDVDRSKIPEGTAGSGGSSDSGVDSGVDSGTDAGDAG